MRPLGIEVTVRGQQDQVRDIGFVFVADLELMSLSKLLVLTGLCSSISCLLRVLMKTFISEDNETEFFDALSVLRDYKELPDGITRAPGRCQSPLENNYTAIALNENATVHQLTAGMFYNTFPEDFSIMAVVRLPGSKKNVLYLALIAKKSLAPSLYVLYLSKRVSGIT